MRQTNRGRARETEERDVTEKIGSEREREREGGERERVTDPAAAALPGLGSCPLVAPPLAAVEASQAGHEGLVLIALQQLPPNHL